MNPTSVRVEISFKAEVDGGRSTALDLHSGRYRPHFRVGNGEYLGVAMLNGSTDLVLPGSCACADAVLVYEPNVDYAALAPGAVFDVLEGAQVVGTGTVLS
jgi:translation elongation factor EF-Tu-like GTPase